MTQARACLEALLEQEWPAVLRRLYDYESSALQARQEFEECQKRVGQATAAYLDDLPTYRYTAELSGLIARAKQAMGTK